MFIVFQNFEKVPVLPHVTSAELSHPSAPPRQDLFVNEEVVESQSQPVYTYFTGTKGGFGAAHAERPNGPYSCFHGKQKADVC
jgi:hypothetical protein